MDDLVEGLGEQNICMNGWLSRVMDGYIGIAAACYVDVLCFKSRRLYKKLKRVT